MSIVLLAAALAALQPAPPSDAVHVTCAIQKAHGFAAAAPAETPEAIAEKVIAACAAAAAPDAPPATDATRFSMRAAAVAVVNRARGTDGQAADAPLRVPSLERQAAVSSMQIPDEIAPAVVPYVRCVIASAGVPMYTAGRKALIPPPPGIGKGSDCSAIRHKAAQDAEKLLKRSGKMPRRERQAFIERVLSEAGNFSIPTPPRAPNQ